MTANLVSGVLQMLVVGAGAPLLLGLVRTLKARFVGRRGPDPWQPYADLRKLLAKEAVVSATTSWIFQVTPYVLVATMLTAALIVPALVARPALGFAGGAIFLMHLFLLGTFFLALAGLDAGSAFGGMGSTARWRWPPWSSPPPSWPSSPSPCARRPPTWAASCGAWPRTPAPPRTRATCWPSPPSSSSCWPKRGASRWTTPPPTWS